MIGKVHKTQRVIEWCCDNSPAILKKGLTEFPQCMPEEYRGEDVVKAYRSYYLGEKMRFAKWVKRVVPYWVK